jgi:branched-subunit amino acid transport protein
MTTLLVMFAVGAGSYLLRSGPIIWHGRAQPPPWVDRAALFAATSALAAVVTAAVLHHERAGHPEARTAAIIAVGMALTLAIRKVSMLRVIVGGLAVYELASLALSVI